MSILNWFANTWKAVMSVFVRIWQAAKEASLAAWNSDSMIAKLAAALLVAIGATVVYLFFWGLPISAAAYTVGSLTATIAISLTGIHMVAVFAWRLFVPVVDQEEEDRKFAEQYPAGRVTDGPDLKAQAARRNTRVVA